MYVIKDLVPDLTNFYDQYKVRLYIISKKPKFGTLIIYSSS